jgi:hypothetical protein
VADTSVQPIPGVTLTPEALTFYYSLPADKQAAIKTASDAKSLNEVVKAFNAMGIHTWADVQANQNSMIGPFQFWGVPGLQQGAQAVNGAADAATSVSDFLGRLSDPHMWVRIMLVGIGAALVVTALGMLARPVIAPAAAAAGKVLP